MKQNLYLGIDGVIITKGVQPALHLDKFLEFVLSNFSVSWLTTRCKGNSQETINYLSQFLLPSTIAIAKQIKPTHFNLDKTEAIDFKKDFYWLESQLFDSEKRILKENFRFSSWIELDLIKNPNQLHKLVSSKLSFKRGYNAREDKNLWRGVKNI